MSYDLAVWEGEPPADDAAGRTEFWVRFNELEDHPDLEPTPAIRAYVDALLDLYPELIEDVDSSPWSTAPLIREANGSFIYFPMTYSSCAEVSSAAARLAKAHGLVCFDPQIKRLRPTAEAHGVGYVFAIGCDFTVTTSGHERLCADRALDLVEPRGWNRRSAGSGSKGRRLYDWAWIALSDPRQHLLIRRKIGSPRELGFYLAHVPDHYVCSLTDLVKVAGTRWAVEEGFQDAKQAVALDETQVRIYRAWKRHVTLAVTAYAVLAVAAATAKAAHRAPVLPDDADRPRPADTGMIALTVPEIQRLLSLILPGRTRLGPDIGFHLRWSEWRRRHQARARWHHYRKRTAPTL